MAGDLVFPRHSTVDIDSELFEPEVEIVADAEGSTEEGGGGLQADGGGDEEGGEGVEDADDSRDTKRARKCQKSLPEVHVVTSEDVDSGAFNITDVVLPMPG